MPRKRTTRIRKAASDNKINKLLLHEYSYSDFPASFLKGMFSCSACDDWRIRQTHGRRYKKVYDQYELKTAHMRCQQSKRGKKPIRIRVVLGGLQSNEVATINGVPDDNSNGNLSQISILDQKAMAKAAAKAADNERKDMVARQVRERLALAAVKKNISKAVEVFNCSLQSQLTIEKSKSLALECQLSIEQKRRVEAEEAIVEEQKKVKRLRNQVLYYKTSLSSALAKRNAIVTDGDKSSFDSLVDQIENAFGIMKGAHPSTKAAKLLEIISAGLLFNGEGISIHEGMHRDYIRNEFLPRKLVYASVMSPAGSFWTATATGLSEFFDEPESDNVMESKKKRIFPSASKVSRERQALNRYAISRVGLTRRSSPCGEIYHLDPERVI
jgi:hypothetical protein